MDTPQFALRPSAASVWSVCHGYVAMSAQYPEQPGDDEVREDGTACHEVAYQMGQHGRVYQVGEMASNGRVITQEMLDAAQGYLAELRSWGLPVYLETTLPAHRIHAQCGGTPDAFAVDRDRMLIRLADLKFGFIPVEVFENLQLIVYLTAILDWIGVDGLSDQVWQVEFTIYQPRDFGREPAKKWRFRACDIRGIVNQLIEAAHWAMSPNPRLQAGPYCSDCSARHACQVLKASGGRVLQMSGQAVPLELDPSATGDELRRLEMALEIIKARISGLQQRAEYFVRNGAHVPWYEMQSHKGRRRWKEGVQSQVIAAGKMLGVDLTEPTSAISPAQAEKKLKDLGVLKQFVETPSSMKLVRTDVNYVRKMMESINNGN